MAKHQAKPQHPGTGGKHRDSPPSGGTHRDNVTPIPGERATGQKIVDQLGPNSGGQKFHTQPDVPGNAKADKFGTVARTRSGRSLDLGFGI